MTNLSAGIGDPYWYEWSVGLLYALDMLNLDNNIKHVILQASKFQGLDDVVVVYNDNQAECIQIKHTREYDTLTFSDMIYSSDKKESYLRRFCNDWKKAQARGYRSCKAVLFTNRQISKRKNTPDKSWERPALEKFWSDLKNKLISANSISDIFIEPEWQEAWKHWIAEMSNLNDDEKICFLKSFDIKGNQEDLNEIINSIAIKITNYFKTDNRKAIQLHQKLCYSLMTWSTTLRTKEEITREDLLSALSLCNDEIVGEHNLPTCEPFFNSRVEFAHKIEDILKRREAPIVFLSGEPGVGKTNIVSYISNKIDSVITLRFHAFKPLDSKDLYMSADKGISDPKALWGNLLIELRALFIGKLSKYKVPVSNELLDSIESIRGEVLRLSNALASETGVITVIAIDGIDHAARVGENNTFLSTLIPPEGVPENVCFLIAGQPIHQYAQYPDWLADSERVLKIDVPAVEDSDIRQLYDNANISIPKENVEAAIRLISKTVEGNTLSAVFAIHEAKQCLSIEELECLLERKQLASGVFAYYEYIWKSAIDMIPKQFFYIDTILAGVLSLVNKKITPETMATICKDEGISKLAWKKVMHKLYPIVVNINDQYMVFHNDIRIYLEKYLRKDIATFIDVAGKLADYFMSENSDIRIKHELIFMLLKYANRENEYVDLFTKEYIIEALKVKRPMREITEQLEITLKSLLTVEDFRKILNLGCAVATLYQFKQSLQWMDKKYEAEVDLPIVLNSERKVPPKTLITIDVLLQMMVDTRILIEHNEINRAKNNMKRWFSDLTPEDVVELLILNKVNPEEKITSDIDTVLEKWGRLSQYTDINYSTEINDQVSLKFTKRARGNFAKGWLAEGQLFLNEKRVLKTLNNLQYYLKEDLESYLNSIIDNNDANIILRILKPELRNNFSNVLKLRIVVWAILNNYQDLYKEWIKEILEKRFYYIGERSNVDIREVFPKYSLIVFVLSYFGLYSNAMIKECLEVFKSKDFSPKDRSYHSAYNLLISSSFCGHMCSHINNDSIEYISIKDFEACINQLFDTRDSIGKYDVGGNEVEKCLLDQMKIMTNKLDKTFQNLLLDTVVKKIQNHENIAHINFCWSYLVENNHLGVLEGIYEQWMNADSLVWKMELSEINYIADNFISKASQLGWIDKVNYSKKLLDNKLVGYTGRKEYSLFSVLRWYERISTMNNIYWEDEGLKLLNISQCASDTGDNRAAIYVDAVVAESAGKQGAKALWNFANMKKHWDSGWLQTIFDGIIAALEFNSFSKDDLLLIWEVSTKAFFVLKNPTPYDNENRLRSIYIADIKEAILLTAKRFKYVGIEEDMRNISSLEFAQSRDSNNYNNFNIPIRWYDNKNKVSEAITTYIYKTESGSYSQDFRILEEQFINDRSKFSWDFVVDLIQRIEQDSRECVSDYLPKVLKLLSQRHDAYYWEWDGANRLYEVIFKYLNNFQISEVLGDLVNKYFDSDCYSDESKLFGLNSDLDNFSYYYYSKLSESENVDALNELIKMHIDWITGNRSIPLAIHFERQGNFADNTFSWNDFCKGLKAKL